MIDIGINKCEKEVMVVIKILLDCGIYFVMGIVFFFEKVVIEDVVIEGMKEYIVDNGFVFVKGRFN